MEDSDRKIFYSIGEVATILDESVSRVRFWTNSFDKYVKPKRNAKGNRLYTAKEIDFLKQIKLLVSDRGMTLEGAARKVALERSSVEARVRVLDSLREIRTQLMEIKSSL